MGGEVTPTLASFLHEPAARMPSLLRSFHACALALAVAAPDAAAQDAVIVNAMRDPVDKSYRKMAAGMDLFEKRRHLAPAASLRFKLLPRHHDTGMKGIALQVVGNSFEFPVELAPDNTFTLPRDRLALKENARVRPDRKAGTMTWRAEIRTPGLPPDVRRLGDLRLECQVGMQAGLISNVRKSVMARIADLMLEGPAYCEQPWPRYLFFSDRPLWSVTLQHGERLEALSVDHLYAGASANPKWREELPYCDCEVLLDRAYFMPLGDASWPDDTRVRFEYMDDAPAQRSPGKAAIRARFGPAIEIPLASGYAVWVYHERPEPEKGRAPELVLLFEPAGLLTKARMR
jgi:hypothetical protein